MRKLTYFVAMTIDGFVAGPDGGDPTGDLFAPDEEYLGRIVEHFPETLPTPARVALGVTAAGDRFDTVVEGRRSYEVGPAAGISNAYAHLRHIVYSRTLGQSPDPAVEVVASDPAAHVRELKQQPGKGIWLVGGGDLAGTLFPEIDELVIKLSPVAIGKGIPLFGSQAGYNLARFRLTDHQLLGSGTAFLTYAKV
ncbi:dihydrofolate reductase family protein [Flindersiella endophytica]